MIRMGIKGLGLVGGFGSGHADLCSALDENRRATSEVELRGHPFPLYRAETAGLETYLNKRALRRIDHFSRLALLGAYQALDDAGQPDIDHSRLGVVLCSGYGALATTFKFLDSVLEDGDPFASPTAFSNSVHNAAAAHIAMQLKVTGPSLTVSQFDQSFVSGLLTARQWFEDGRVDAILLGAVDEYCSVLGYCWERFFPQRDQTGMDPFDISRETAVAGEGSAFFLLTPEPGENMSYATIDDIAMGNLKGSQPACNGPLLLNCDGARETGALYRDQLSDEHRVACYTPVYGASPVSQAFDVAVAALALKRQKLFPSAATARPGFPGQVVSEEVSCSALSCLRFSLGGDYGVVRLSGAGR